MQLNVWTRVTMLVMVFGVYGFVILCVCLIVGGVPCLLLGINFNGIV